MQLLIRTPAETKEFLQKEAQKIGITMNALVLVILQNWIQEKKKQRCRFSAQLVTQTRPKQVCEFGKEGNDAR